MFEARPLFSRLRSFLGEERAKGEVALPGRRSGERLSGEEGVVWPSDFFLEDFEKKFGIFI